MANVNREGASPPPRASDRPVVMVVDDDSDMTRYLSAVVATRGLSPVPAYDAKQGMDLAQRVHPRLIIVDWHMSAGGGPEMLRRLREDSTTVIVVTADSAPNVREEAIALGATLFLYMPLDPERLMDALRLWLRAGST
jgi:DNA-binding response OmpR family regulator